MNMMTHRRRLMTIDHADLIIAHRLITIIGLHYNLTIDTYTHTTFILTHLSDLMRRFAANLIRSDARNLPGGVGGVGWAVGTTISSGWAATINRHAWRDWYERLMTLIIYHYLIPHDLMIFMMTHGQVQAHRSTGLIEDSTPQQKFIVVFHYHHLLDRYASTSRRGYYYSRHTNFNQTYLPDTRQGHSWK